MADKAPDLIATCWTIAGNVRPDRPDPVCAWPLEDRIEAAARAGYTGIGLWLGDLRQWRRDRRTNGYAALHGVLADNGLCHIELEFLSNWFADGEARAQSDVNKIDLFAAASDLGARHIKVMPPFGGQKLAADRLAERFAALCDEAARYNLIIALEMIPFSDIPTLPDALDIVARADASNGGLLIDIWHVVRSGSRVEDVAAISARFIKAVELCDADLAMHDSITEDTMCHRRLCGEGQFDVSGFITALAQAGYDGPYGVEILSDSLRRASLAEAARSSFDTAIRQFGRG